MNLFQDFDSRFETPLRNFMGDAISNLSSTMSSPLRVALLLYVVLYGYHIIRGTINEPILDFAWRCIKLAIIFVLATKAGTYHEYVTQVFFEALPKEIQSAFDLSSTAEPNAFDALFSKSIELGLDMFGQADTFDFHIYILGALVMVIGGITCLVMYAITLFAKVALALVIAVGPVFIALMLFSATRRFGESWIGSLVNFVILQVLAVAIVGLLITVMETLIKTDSSGGAIIIDAVSAIVVFLLGAFIALQLPSIATGLAGAGASLRDPAQSLFQSAAQRFKARRQYSYRN